MSYRDALDALSAQGEAALVETWRLLAGGIIDRPGAVARIVSTVGLTNAQAVALADQAVAATLMLQLGQPVAPIGVLPADESERLTAAALTLIDQAGEGDTVARFARLGRAEPLDAAQRAWGQAIDASEYVVGWRRGLSSGACELCRWLEKDGMVYPTSRGMHHHTGCRCEQIIVTEEF